MLKKHQRREIIGPTSYIMTKYAAFRVLNPLQHNPYVLMITEQHMFEHIVRKEENGRKQYFLFFRTFFQIFRRQNTLFYLQINCYIMSITILLSLSLAKGSLTHYHTMSYFYALNTYICGKHCEKRRNCF